MEYILRPDPEVFKYGLPTPDYEDCTDNILFLGYKTKEGFHLQAIETTDEHVRRYKGDFSDFKSMVECLARHKGTKSYEYLHKEQSVFGILNK